MENDNLYLFCYGSNSIEQVRERVGNPNLKAQPAILKNYTLVFCGMSKRWNNGAVASVAKKNSSQVRGSIVALSLQELCTMDNFEGCSSQDPGNVESNVYRREKVQVKERLSLDSYEWIEREAWVYIRNSVLYSTPPSTQYLEAIKKNYLQSWSELKQDEIQIQIIRADSLEFVGTWVGGEKILK